MIEKSWADLSSADFTERWYNEVYSKITYSVLTCKIQSWMHGSLEKKIKSTDYMEKVLELGGNKGEHIDYIKHKYKSYLLTDSKNRLELSELERFQKRQVDFKVMAAEELSIETESIDRLIVTCLLHHLIEPEKALFEMKRVVKIGGQLDIFLSGDPGFLFRLARRIGPESWARKHGLLEVKKLIDARDHRNHIGALQKQIRHVFREDEIIEKSYPINNLGWNFILWKTFRIKKRNSQL